MKGNTKISKDTVSFKSKGKPKKNLIIFASLIIAAAIVIILGFGLRSSAAGSKLEYLDANVFKTDDISYVVLNESGVTCDANVFAGNNDIVTGSRVDGAIIEEAVGICFRARFENDNYIYKKYGDFDSWMYLVEARTWASEEADSSPDVYGIYVYAFANVGSIQYVVLQERGAACDAEAFVASDNGIFQIQNGTLIDLADFGLARSTQTGSPDSELQTTATDTVINAQSLCFRADFDNDNYIYEKYGDIESDIFLHGGWIVNDNPEPESITGSTPTYNQSQTKTPTLPSDLHASAPGSSRLAYTPLSLGGRCNADTFRIDGDYITHTPVGEYQITVDALIVNANDGICFRADYGNGNFVYKEYTEHDGIVFSYMWAFELHIWQSGDRNLVIQSSRDLTSWQTVRSDLWPNNKCDATTFSITQRQATGGAVGTEGAKRSFSIALTPDEDDGRAYCIETTDKEGNKAYATSEIIDLPIDFGVFVYQAGNKLRGITYGIDKAAIAIKSWSALKSDFWLNSQCNADTFRNFESQQISGQNPAETNFTLIDSLSQEDLEKYYCFRFEAANSDRWGLFYTWTLVTGVENPFEVDMTIENNILETSVPGQIAAWDDRQLQPEGQYSPNSVCDEEVYDLVTNDVARGNRYWDSNNPWLARYQIELTLEDNGSFFCIAVHSVGGSTSYVTSPLIDYTPSPVIRPVERPESSPPLTTEPTGDTDN